MSTEVAGTVGRRHPVRYPVGMRLFDRLPSSTRPGDIVTLSNGQRALVDTAKRADDLRDAKCTVVILDAVSEALAKARRAFRGETDAEATSFDGIEALAITPEEGDASLYRIDANVGWADVVVAEGLARHVAVGIAHAIDAAFGCGVYMDGERL